MYDKHLRGYFAFSLWKGKTVGAKYFFNISIDNFQMMWEWMKELANDLKDKLLNKKRKYWLN